MSATSLLTSAIAIAFLWRDGLWLFIAMLPYGLSYLFYRGAVVTAREYGTAMAALIALNRYALYDRLGVPRPSSTEEERTHNERLAAMYAFEPYTELIEPVAAQPRRKWAGWSLLRRERGT